MEDKRLKVVISPTEETRLKTKRLIGRMRYDLDWNTKQTQLTPRNVKRDNE